MRIRLGNWTLYSYGQYNCVWCSCLYDFVLCDQFGVPVCKESILCDAFGVLFVNTQHSFRSVQCSFFYGLGSVRFARCPVCKDSIFCAIGSVLLFVRNRYCAIRSVSCL